MLTKMADARQTSVGQGPVLRSVFARRLFALVAGGGKTGPRTAESLMELLATACYRLLG